MSEWWSYGLSDFLMFSPQAYWRLVARYNAAWWPAQVLGAAAAVALLALLPRPGTWAARAALLLLAAAWAWTGWAFHAQRHAEIFLAAPWLAAACAVQAVLLVGVASIRVRTAGAHSRTRDLAGSALVAAALLYPLAAPLQGRGWAQAEVFGFMPDPTALATLGALVALRHPGAGARALLAAIPLLSLLFGAATRWLLA
jgi:hypothetical protein